MPTEITDADELQAMSANLAGDYILMNDIDGSSMSSWNSGAGFAPVGPDPTTFFSGKLNGQGFRIGLFIDRPAVRYVGLFGATSDAEIFDFELSASVRGLRTVGAVVGRIATITANRIGVLAGSTVTDETTDFNSDSGGFVGFMNGGTISDSYSHASATSAANRPRLGGFVGDSRSTLTRCYSTGEVTSSGSNVGGLAGNTSGGTFTECFWDTQTSGRATSAGGTGKTTAQMKTLSTFTAASWDIVSGLDETKVWGIDGGINDGYPFLQVFEDSAPPSGTAFWRTRQSSQLSTAGVIG